MAGEFYVENKAEKVDLSDIKNTITEVQGDVDQLQADAAQVQSGVATLVTKSEGAAPVTGSTTADWQTAEADAVTIGAPGARYKVHSLLLSIHSLTGSAVTVRMYMTVNGNERRIYEQTFDVAVDPPGLWIINGTVGIHDVLRVTLQSNSAVDNGRTVDYDYMVEVMR